MSKLAKKSVNDADTLPKPYLLWDGELHGFGLLVLPSTVKTNILQYRNEAQELRRLTIGRNGVISVVEAGEAVVAVVKGSDPVANRIC